VVDTVPPVAQVLERVVESAPLEAGFARITTAQLEAAAKSAVRQVSVTIVKSLRFERVGALHPVAGPLPEFERVKVWVLEFDPTSTVPKLWVRGLKARNGCVPVTVICSAVVDTVPP
jgi:hypothetical protein